MGFKQFITNLRYRKHIEAEFDRLQNLQPPNNPSPRYIDKRVRQILHPYHAQYAVRELEMLGPLATPALLAALNDPRFTQIDTDEDTTADAPLDVVLGLLVPHEPLRVIEIASDLMTAESEEARQIGAIHSGHTGRPEALPVIRQALVDKEPYVRSYALIGLDRALDDGLMSDTLRDRVYGPVLAQCTERWRFSGNDSAQLLIRLDPERAAVDLAGEHVLSENNPNVSEVLEACNSASIALPADRLRLVFENALPRVTGKHPYPHDYTAAAALELLAVVLPEHDTRQLIDRAVSVNNDRLTESAARAVARLAGIDEPSDYALDRVGRVGYGGLTEPQRVVYCATVFDDEVSNGGVMQFFGNSSGDHAADTLIALERIGHEEGFAALDTAVRAAGPRACEADRDLRLQALAGRYDELQELLGPLESAYYKTNAQLRAKVVLFAAEHADDFR